MKHLQTLINFTLNSHSVSKTSEIKKNCIIMHINSNPERYG